MSWITPLPAPIHSLRLKGQVAHTIMLDQTHVYWIVDGDFAHIFRYPLEGGEVETIATSQFADGDLQRDRPIRTGDWLIVLDSRTVDDTVWVLHALSLTDQSDSVVTQGNGSTVMRGLAADGDWVAWTLLEESASCTSTGAQTVLAVHNLKSGEQRELDRACSDKYIWFSPGLSGNRLVAGHSGVVQLFDLASGQRTTLTNGESCDPTVSDVWIVWTTAECGGWDTTDVVYNLQSGERRIVHGPGEPSVRHGQTGRWLYWLPPSPGRPLTIYDLETGRMLIVTTLGDNEIIRDVVIHDNMIAWARDLDPSTAAVHDSVLEWRTLLPSQPTTLSSVEIPTSCVAHSEDSAPYFNLTDGYCLLYPAHFRVYDVRPGVAGFYVPPPEQTIDPVFGALSILVEGPAAGRTLAQVVDHYVSVYQSGEGVVVTRSTATLGGEPAEVVEGPGDPVGSRQVFVLHNDTIYHLGMYPVDEAFPQAAPYVEAVWQAVSASFTFLPEEFVAALSSCRMETIMLLPISTSPMAIACSTRSA